MKWTDSLRHMRMGDVAPDALPDGVRPRQPRTDRMPDGGAEAATEHWPADGREAPVAAEHRHRVGGVLWERDRPASAPPARQAGFGPFAARGRTADTIGPVGTGACPRDGEGVEPTNAPIGDSRSSSDDSHVEPPEGDPSMLGAPMLAPPMSGTAARRRRAPAAVDTGRVRLMVMGMVLGLAFLAVGVRLVDVSVLSSGNEPSLAESAVAPAEAPKSRADIVDRNGMLLATTLPSVSLFADPKLIPDPAAAVADLVEIMPGLDANALYQKLADRERRFVWIQRHITPRQQFEINALGIPGIDFHSEERRFFPGDRTMAHIVGFTNVDGTGLAGVEARFDRRLRDEEAPLALSIDLRLQEIVRRELQAAIDTYSAIGGAAIVQDVRTGEVRAMVSLPDFDPYTPGDEADEGRFIRTTLGVYEMGSTFKIFNTAAALDAGTTTIANRYDATQPIRIGGFQIRDFHAEDRWLTVPEIFVHSSNIGSVRMAVELGRERQQEYLRRLGLLTPSTVELAERQAPLVPAPWRPINTMTISYGHGISVSPVQLTTAVAAVVNGGIYRPATLLRRQPGEPVPGERVLHPQTSDIMRRLLRLVVNEGTGRRANAEGYLVGGKTGTAEKQRGGGYDRDSRLSSFVAAFPMTSPRFVVFAMLDEPKGTQETFGYATGGWVAAPVVRRIVEQMAPLVGIPPLDEDRPDVRDALHIDLVPDASSQLAALDR